MACVPRPGEHSRVNVVLISLRDECFRESLLFRSGSSGKLPRQRVRLPLSRKKRGERARPEQRRSCFAAVYWLPHSREDAEGPTRNNHLVTSSSRQQGRLPLGIISHSARARCSGRAPVHPLLSHALITVITDTVVVVSPLLLPVGYCVLEAESRLPRGPLLEQPRAGLSIGR